MAHGQVYPDNRLRAALRPNTEHLTAIFRTGSRDLAVGNEFCVQERDGMSGLDYLPVLFFLKLQLPSPVTNG